MLQHRWRESIDDGDVPRGTCLAVSVGMAEGRVRCRSETCAQMLDPEPCGGKDISRSVVADSQSFRSLLGPCRSQQRLYLALLSWIREVDRWIQVQRPDHRRVPPVPEDDGPCRAYVPVPVASGLVCRQEFVVAVMRSEMRWRMIRPAVERGHRIHYHTPPLDPTLIDIESRHQNRRIWNRTWMTKR